MSPKEANAAAVKLLGPMAVARIHKKSGPGSSRQIGLRDVEGVVYLDKPFDFKKVSEGRTFEEALHQAELATAEIGSIFGPSPCADLIGRS